ncbi:MAG: hypothetical protein J5678_04305 [Bacteroidaceae bacterium]|nr:hypothetical protein [Bacteroidaceae bacterium]
MKLNAITSIVAVLIAGLLAYLFYTISKNDDTALATAIAGFLSLGVVLGGMMGVKLQDSKHNTNLRLVSILFFLIGLIFHLIAALSGTSVPFVIIFAGLILVIYILAAYTIAKAKM